MCISLSSNSLASIYPCSTLVMPVGVHVSTVVTGTLTFGCVPWIKLMLYLWIILSHNFPDGGVSVSSDYLYINPITLKPIQTTPESHWLHGNRIFGLGHLQGGGID